MNVLLPLILAILLYLLGIWGRVNAESLAPPSLPDEARRQRVRVLRRGAVTCQVLAFIFVGISTIVFFGQKT